MKFLFVCVVLALLVMRSVSYVKVAISQTLGVNNSSCHHTNGTFPCKSISYALGILNDNYNHFDDETIFVFSIEDKHYDLVDKVHIFQSRPERKIFLKSANNITAVIRGGSELAGIHIGSQTGKAISAYNIDISHVEFQHFSAKFDAVVNVFNAINVSFHKCAFISNKQPGINAFDSSVTIEGCLFCNNTSRVQHARFRDMPFPFGGGARFVFVNAKGLNVVVRNTKFTRNSVLPHSSKFESRKDFDDYLPYCGGGLLVVFRSVAESNKALVKNTVFENNKAYSGGGFYCSSFESAKGNEINVQGSRFVSNNAPHIGGGMRISIEDTPSTAVIVESCVFRENWSRTGGGAAVLAERLKSDSSVQMQFQNVIWEKNTAHRSAAAIALETSAASVQPIDVEFTNCTIQNHSASKQAFTGAFKSFGVNVNFTGTNLFSGNRGAGAMDIRRGVVNVQNILKFIKNSGSKAGAVTFSENSRMVLYPGSEVAFLQNHADGFGGAISVFTRPPDDVVRPYNPNCFVTYSEELAKPSKWKTKVSFLNNSATFKGAAVYISTLQDCLWYKEYPFYSYERALRWKNAFEYRGNFLVPGKNLEPLIGEKYDIATDTHYFDTTEDVTEINLSPGEEMRLSIYAYDELNNKIFTPVIFNKMFDSKVNPALLLDNNIAILPASNGSFTLKYSMANEYAYKELASRAVNSFQLIDAYTMYKNAYAFNITPILCKPGFKFESSVCTCDNRIEGLLRCCDDRRTVYLKEGYWGQVENGRLKTYVCPPNYCKCVHNGDLPGCVFDANHLDNQCAPNRTGVLCGQCKKGLSVGLSRAECINCEGPIWIVVVYAILVIVIVVLVIVLNPRLPSELRGALFFFQALPFIFAPKNIRKPVHFVANLFSFGGPFIHIPGSCIFAEITNLSAAAMGYLIPFIAIILFLISYVLSAKLRLLNFKKTKHSRLRSLWIITLFMYNYLAVTSFMLFNCPEVGGKKVFFYDGNVQCFKGTHLFLAILALIVLVFLVVPLPIVVILLTKGYWRTTPQYYGTLTDGLKTPCSSWWSVDLLRRLLFMSTYVFISNWRTKQVTMFLVCAVILALHSIFQPYKRKRANMVETGYLLSLCIITNMQLLVNLEETETATQKLAFYVSWLFLILPMAHLSFFLFIKAFRVIRKKYHLLRSGREGYEELDSSTSAKYNQDYEEFGLTSSSDAADQDNEVLDITTSSEVDQDLRGCRRGPRIIFD